MKKLLILLTVALALTAFAYSGTVAALYTVDATNDAPTLSTQGIPLFVNNKPVVAVGVTVEDYNDGGADHEFLRHGAALAWVLRPEVRYPDGGAGWARIPTMDLSLDAGTVFTHGISAMAPQVSPESMIPGTRLYYQTSGMTGQDGGTPRHSVFLEGRY